ncbi:MAG: phosphoadenylyl-sulfate reductase [Chloroflexi bacterium]|nr:phosphoadenylyl-sulfate reductase [Chloroflexota bacterium]
MISLKPSESWVSEQASLLETKSAEEIIRWTLDSFGQRAALCTSFQAEGMVILDLACRVSQDVRVFTIDTGRLPQETYELIDSVRERYGIEVEVYYPDAQQLSELVTKHGVNPFYRSVSLRMLCCEVRKVNPLNKALAGLDAWVTGLRRSQSSTRASVQKVELDREHGGIVKVNPLADWTSEQVWEHIRANGVPYNALYDKGYTSIGCAPCTRAIEPGEDERAGRWWWENGVPKECGIHVSPAWSKAARSGGQEAR